jgi:hypothetical protein
MPLKNWLINPIINAILSKREICLKISFEVQTPPPMSSL